MKGASPNLCDLPLELLSKILEELEWREVLRIRKTCKYLCEASKTRSIWLNFCRPYTVPTTTAPKALHLERPIHLYRAHELEFQFLRMKSADIGWRASDKIPARLREIPTTRQARSLHMVEGGRWLLAMFKTGTVTCYDLDAPVITESILIPDQFDPENSFNCRMTIATDRESPFLAFTLALSFCSYSSTKTPPANPKEHCIQIWKVVLVLDETQRGIGLRSALLASFPLEPLIRNIYFLSLLGPHIAFTANCPKYYGYKMLLVVNWQAANGESFNYPRRSLYPVGGGEYIQLLPGNRIFLLTSILILANYLGVEETTSLLPYYFQGHTFTRQQVDFPNEFRPKAWVSRPFYCSDSIRFTFCSNIKPQHIYGLIINDRHDLTPIEDTVEFRKLMPFPDICDRSTTFGYNKTLTLNFHNEPYLISYSWPDDADRDLPPLWLHKKKSSSLVGRSTALVDDESGCVVTCAQLRLVIWDFSLEPALMNTVE